MFLKKPFIVVFKEICNWTADNIICKSIFFFLQDLMIRNFSTPLFTLSHLATGANRERLLLCNGALPVSSTVGVSSRGFPCSVHCSPPPPLPLQDGQRSGNVASTWLHTCEYYNPHVPTWPSIVSDQCKYAVQKISSVWTLILGSFIQDLWAVATKLIFHRKRVIVHPFPKLHVHV